MTEDQCWDVLVVGGGVVGCAVARELAAAGQAVLLCEVAQDLLAGASSANTGHLATNFYYRRERALLEAEMSARAREENPAWLAGQPAVPRSAKGMLYLAGPAQLPDLARLLRLGRLNNVPGLRPLQLDEVAKLEPGLCLAGVEAALLSSQEVLVGLKSR